jgi:hypothetical protein
VRLVKTNDASGAVTLEGGLYVAHVTVGMNSGGRPRSEGCRGRSRLERLVRRAASARYPPKRAVRRIHTSFELFTRIGQSGYGPRSKSGNFRREVNFVRPSDSMGLSR